MAAWCSPTDGSATPRPRQTAQCRCYAELLICHDQPCCQAYDRNICTVLYSPTQQLTAVCRLSIMTYCTFYGLLFWHAKYGMFTCSKSTSHHDNVIVKYFSQFTLKFHRCRCGYRTRILGVRTMYDTKRISWAGSGEELSHTDETARHHGKGI